MNDDQFSQRPFAAGALTGIRSFQVDVDGTLTGVWHRHRFTPGENVAACCIRHSGIFSMTVCHRADAEPVNHRPGSLRCSCGYYAYFDAGHNPHHGTGNVLALVEGYGLMSVGDRGFRCEKARLVAFIDEATTRPPLKVAAARWLITKGSGLLNLGRPVWSTSTVPAAVRCTYPDVPVYAGVWAALAAHPLTRPERPREEAA